MLRKYDLDELQIFIDDSLRNLIQLNNQGKFSKDLAPKELTGVRIFRNFLIAQIEEAKKIEQK